MSILSNFTAYVKQTWANSPSKSSPVSASRLGHMESGIKANSDAIQEIVEAVMSEITNDPDKIASMAALYKINQSLSGVASTAQGKVDKDGVGQVTYAMLAQDVKEAMAGDKVAVVGADSVTSEHIKDNSIKQVDLMRSITRTRVATQTKPLSANRCFNINRSTGEVTKTTTEKVICFNDITTFTIDFSTVGIVVKDDLTSVTHVNLWFDYDKKELHFCRLETENGDYFENMFNLGMINFSNPLATDCLIPFTINTDLFFHPKKSYGRRYVPLHVAYAKDNTDAVAYVDWSSRKLVFPPFNSMFVMRDDGYAQLYGTHASGLELEFPEGITTYAYLVGGADGLKLLSPTEFGETDGVFSMNQSFYFGYLFISGEQAYLNTKCVSKKTISFLGDSITTFKGYIPSGNSNYYTGSNCGVTSVNQCWWRRVCLRMGYELNTNNAWSGSRVTNTASTTSNAMARATLLDNGMDPDVIIFYMGINDFNNEVALGTYDGRGPVPTDGSTFREAYAIALDNMMKKYKTSKIYVCTLPTVERSTSDITSPESNENGVYLADYNKAIREIAHAFCAEIIELESCGITHYNASEYMGDYSDTGSFTHPNSKGHLLIAEKVIRSIG